MAADESVRVGIVGLGGMGRLHAGNAREFGHEVVGGADVAPDPREAFGAEFDVPTFEGHEEMYDAVDPDAVVVTTPNAFHAPAAVSALERDVDVLCEKPLADSLEGAERIHAADRDSDAFCMVGFSNRFSVAGELLTAYRERGAFGDITHVEANYLRRRGIPGLGSWFTNRELSGGGAVIDIGVHAIDFALYAAGFPAVEEVSAETRANFGTREDYEDVDNWSDNWTVEGSTFDVDDSASAFVRCAGGTTISLEVSWATNREPTNEIVVRGTEAGAKCALGGDEVTLYGAGTDGVDHYVDSDLSGDMDPAGHAAEDELFLDAVAAGERPEMNTVDQGLAVQRVLDAVYRSSEQGRAVSV